MYEKNTWAARFKFHFREEIAFGQCFVQSQLFPKIYFSILNAKENIKISIYSSDVIKRIYKVYR